MSILYRCCAWCRRVYNEHTKEWETRELPPDVEEHTSHGICRTCKEEHFPGAHYHE